jgi:hypothetical protein
MMRRTQPVNGFSRGLPMRKPEPAASPAGRYYYHIPVLVQRDGRALEADSLEVNFPAPMVGASYVGIVRRYQAEQYPAPVPSWFGRVLVALRLRKPAAVLIPLTPNYLGFVAQEEQVDAAVAEDAAAAKAKAEAADRATFPPPARPIMSPPPRAASKNEGS